MRTSWEQAREEAIKSAVQRGMSRLQGVGDTTLFDESGPVIAPASTPTATAASNPTLAAQIISIASDVASKVQQMYPAASPQAVNASAIQKTAAAVGNTVLTNKQKTPGVQLKQATVGMSSNTKILLVVGVGAALGLGAIMYFRSRRAR